MKKFVAIGHWDFSKNITCTAGEARTMGEFKDDLRGNGFTPWLVLSAEKVSAYKAADVFGRLDMISSRNRHCLDIQDYMNECMDIIENKLATI